MIPTIRVSPEELRRFVEAYEEKRRIVSELEVLETKVRKGKIPRRRYKIRRKTLESRISSLNRRIAELKERIRRAGARYADAIRQLEVAETELETVEVDIRRIEARYRRGEVSRGVYRRLLEEYNKRKEKALVTIDGVLIRFSEEIR
jgi:DNA repair exonuclease SbcCD ATPase subunit